MTGNNAGPVTGRALGDGGRGVSCLLESSTRVSAEDSLGQVTRGVSCLQYCFDGRLFIETGGSAGQVTGRTLRDGGKGSVVY